MSKIFVIDRLNIDKFNTLLNENTLIEVQSISVGQRYMYVACRLVGTARFDYMDDFAEKAKELTNANIFPEATP